MRVLLLFRGAPGCGKSTFIEKNGLKNFVLSADDIRMQCAAPIMTPDGNIAISQFNDKVVWETLFQMLEIRMKNGEFTVVDATNSKTIEMTRYRDLARKYRYRIYIIDMTGIPIEETKRRNAGRPELKRVPDFVIDRMYSRFESQNIPAGITPLKPDELDKIWFRPMDISRYEKLHFIGDIHGCDTALEEYLKGGINPNEYYVFLGDYIDRGIENAAVVTRLMEYSKLPNCYFLEGNHEYHLRNWAEGEDAVSKEFRNNTQKELEETEISKRDVREFCRRLGQCAYLDFHGITLFATHGGLSNLPENLTFVSTSQMIKGVGKYEDADMVDASFCSKTADNVYQIHGHRNVRGSEIQSASRAFNLEDRVEFGGNLRCVDVAFDGNKVVFNPVEIKNPVYKLPDMRTLSEKEVDNHMERILSNSDSETERVEKLVEAMRNDSHIEEKKFGNVSSFNFTRDAFAEKNWNSLVNKARGLFIDTTVNKVVARSYNKFFNLGERPETEMPMLKENLVFPVRAYVKENGFLGMISWDHANDTLFFATKSSIYGDAVEILKKDFFKIYGGTQWLTAICQYLRENEVTIVVECCDSANNSHIIEYAEPKLVLLDVIKNQLEFAKLPYEELCEVADKIGFVHKELAYTLNSWQEFFDWQQTVRAEGYKHNGEEIEGFVMEDATGFMFKLKLYYYNYWKLLRSVANAIFKFGNFRYTQSLTDPLSNKWYAWCKAKHEELSQEEREEFMKDFLTMKKKFFEEVNL